MATTQQRIAIGIIAFLMTFGTIGTYLLIVLQNNEAANNLPSSSQSSASSLPIDPTAYRVKGRVTSLLVKDLTVGSGQEITSTNVTITAQYKGTIAQTGGKFDSSYDRGQPLTISLQSVIPGWQQGMIGMKVGGKRMIVIPASLAYGNQAQGNIPANSDLVFEVELLSIR